MVTEHQTFRTELLKVRRISSVPVQDVVSHQIRHLFAGSRLVPPLERTLALIKPDAVAAGKTDEIIQRWAED